MFILDDLIFCGGIFYTLYVGKKAADTAFDWHAAQQELLKVKSKLRWLETCRPGDFGHPEWAKADGTLDRRRTQYRHPHEMLEKLLEETEAACAKKTKSCFLRC